MSHVERELRKLPPGAQRAVGGGVYMRLDARGRRRFQIRVRDLGSQSGRTFDTWRAAHGERERLVEEIDADVSGGAIGPTIRELRKLKVREYASRHWWKTVRSTCDITTRVDYRRYLPDALAVAGDFTLEQLDLSPLIVDEVKARLVRLKTFPPGHKRAGELPKAAADKSLKILSAISTHAVSRGVMRRNPFVGVPRFNQKRSRRRTNGDAHRAVTPLRSSTRARSPRQARACAAIGRRSRSGG